MVRTTFVALCLVIAGCRCGGQGGPGSSCAADSDCNSALLCRSGKCTATGDGGAGDGGGGGADGGDGGGCVIPCGVFCCNAGDRCEASQCHKDCGTLARCGDPGSESCCGATDVCYLGACVTPGPACTASSQCPTGDYCDPSLGRCLPRGSGGVCEYHPPPGQFAPATLWNYEVTTDQYTQVMMAPVVIDVNGDGLPDVLANFFVGSAYGSPGVMRALSGDDGHVLWSTADTASDHIYPASSIAAGALDSSGKIVVTTISAGGLVIAFDGATGARLWTSHDAAGADAPCAANWGGPALADLNGDGDAEIVCGLAAFDKTGKQLWTHGLGKGRVGPLVLVADLDGDGKPDVTDGVQAWKGDGTALGWTGAGFGGFPATGDFVNASGTVGKDGKPELVSVDSGQIALVSGQSGAVIAGPAPLPSWNGAQCVPGGGTPGNGGPPTVADFDGDGQPEVGVADLDCYSVFKLVPQAGGGVAWSVLWSKKVQDHSSSVTGSSVFDFEGDGKAEAVYADEIALHVYNGADGTEIFTRPHCSGTTYEYPVIVDVNGNGRADIVITENTYAAGGLGCAAGATSGVHVFHDGKDNWVNTRAIWNQHTYHVTNVCDGKDQVCGGPGAFGNTYGRIPQFEPSNWSFNNAPAGSTAPPLDNYRQNVQGDGLFNAPDLVGKDLHDDRTGCPATLGLSVRVLNQGALGVLPGIPVAFYLDGSPRVLLGTAKTTRRLLPGESEVVTVSWTPPAAQVWPIHLVAVVDDDGAGGSVASECHEDNNTAGPVAAGCGNFGLR